MIIFRILEENMWGGNWVFNNGRREPEDQGVSISKIKRHDEVRSRIKRYKIIAIGTARIGKVSIFYNSLSIFYNSLLDWDQVGKAIKRIRGTFEEKEKEYKTFVTEGVYCWRWHCCRLNKIYHQRWGSHRVGNVYKPGKIGLRTETPFWLGWYINFEMVGVINY